MTLRTFCTLLVAVALAACAAPTRLTNSWRDAGFQHAPFKRLLVMGYGDDGANRRVFEDEFVRSLKAAGVDAVPSYSLESGVRETDQAKVRELVARSKADGVLATHLVGVDKRVSVTPGQVMVMPTYRRGFYGYYSTAMVVQTPPTAHNYEVVTLETSLWHVPGESMVWSGTTESFAPDDIRQSTAELARVILTALRGQGLL